MWVGFDFGDEEGEVANGGVIGCITPLRYQPGCTSVSASKA